MHGLPKTVAVSADCKSITHLPRQHTLDTPDLNTQQISGGDSPKIRVWTACNAPHNGTSALHHRIDIIGISEQEADATT